MTVKQSFFDVSSNSENLWKKSRKVTRQWSEVTRPLYDCQTTFVWRFKQFEKILKKVPEGHAAVVGGHATVGWLSNNVFWRFKQFGNILKKVTEGHATVVGGHGPLDDCQTTFFRRFKQFGKILKEFTERHATVIGGHATVVWLSNNVFLTFQAIQKIYEKSHWTVTRQWSEVTRPSADCQITFFGRFKQFEFFFFKVTEGHATVVGGHATVGWLSSTYMHE